MLGAGALTTTRLRLQRLEDLHTIRRQRLLVRTPRNRLGHSRSQLTSAFVVELRRDVMNTLLTIQIVAIVVLGFTACVTPGAVSLGFYCWMCLSLRKASKG